MRPCASGTRASSLNSCANSPGVGARSAPASYRRLSACRTTGSGGGLNGSAGHASRIGVGKGWLANSNASDRRRERPNLTWDDTAMPRFPESRGIFTSQRVYRLRKQQTYFRCGPCCLRCGGNGLSRRGGLPRVLPGGTPPWASGPTPEPLSRGAGRSALGGAARAK